MCVGGGCKGMYVYVCSTCSPLTSNFLSMCRIYECNARCSCGPRCSNRVVQRGLQHRMQVFKTRDRQVATVCTVAWITVPVRRGWGLRSLDDIPKGTFVCTYIGHVYSEEVGNELGTRDGDEYQAELDYIGEVLSWAFLDV